MSEPDLCGCMKCYSERFTKAGGVRREPDGSRWIDPVPGFRYACETCGNKRCPHHTDHDLACTGSNEPGQPGSAFT